MFKFQKNKALKISMNFNYNYPQLAREAGFRLRQYKDGPLDWRLLGSFEIERLMRDQNLEDIDKALVHLSEAPLGSALIDTNILDSGIAKYFIVSQFGIQYLLFCRNFLDETVQELRESHAESQFEIARLQKLLNESNNEILQLHKKMTQMEAIHEVIYPCHLCTKNFANNEALNIHIGRKHGGGGGVGVGNNNDTNNRNKTATTTTSPPAKERAKDLTLINTIKLELEIKQLKERLNSAEKEIKARGIAASVNCSSKSTTPCENERRSVGIQSNLSEEKEQNEAKNDDIAAKETEQADEIAARQKQLAKLQAKIYDIEEWRATQLVNNEESIAEIKRRLNDIAQTLERTTTKTTTIETPASFSENENHERCLERRLSVENLERVLSEKVAEIGKASTDKLTEIVQNMEANYRDKLIELEREVKAAVATKNQNLKQFEADVNSKPFEVQPAPRVKRSTAAATTGAFDDQIIQITKSDDDEGEGEGTYNIELKDVKETNKAIDIKLAVPTSSLTSESNHTFVKVIAQKTKIVQAKVAEEFVVESSSDTTDISESLSEDEANQKIAEPDTKTRLESVAKALEEPNKKMEQLRVSKVKRPKSPKKFTRKDAKNMAAKRLEKCGCNIRMKSLPSSSFKRASIELEERRNKLKQNYPNYYATRNRIKKFVDKLCSSKLPKKAENMLKNKTALQPIKPPRLSKKNTVEERTSLESEESSDDAKQTSDNDNEITNGAANTKDDFKKRLEILLASPIKRPLRMEASTSSKAMLNVEKTAILTKPMPVPRKRVMFDTAANGLM